MTYKYYRVKMELSGINRPKKVFLAEGDSEALFFESLFRIKNYDENEYYVFCFAGISKIDFVLGFLAKEANFEFVRSMGIMLDADQSHNNRTTQIAASLKKHGYINNNDNICANQIYSGINLRIGFFLSPGNSVGNIETMIMREISTKIEFQCIEELNRCYSSVSGQNLSDKALSQVYISIKKANLCGVGRAFEAGILDVNNSAYAEAVQLFTSL